MDRDQFDRLSRLAAAAGTRREALRLLVAGAIAGLTGNASPSAARKRRPARRGNGARVRGEQTQFCTNLCVDCSVKPIRPGANLDRCDFDDESFADGLNLSSAHLAKACFARAELRGARFDGATVNRTCFADADLRGASFRGANVANAVFCGADLRGADFRGTRVTPAQLACATVGCDTILPNGRPAVTCAAGETCCDGVCVDTNSDPQNCGACDDDCGPCQTCEAGGCVAVPNQTLACDGSALEETRLGNRDFMCTMSETGGVCVNGACNCGQTGVYDPDNTICVCDQDAEQICASQCCVMAFVCVDAEDDLVGASECVACG